MWSRRLSFSYSASSSPASSSLASTSSLLLRRPSHITQAITRPPHLGALILCILAQSTVAVAFSILSLTYQHQGHRQHGYQHQHYKRLPSSLPLPLASSPSFSFPSFSSIVPLHGTTPRPFALSTLSFSSSSSSSSSQSLWRKETAILVTSSDNGKIKMWRAWKKKKERDRDAVVLLEGHRLVQDAMEAGHTPIHVLVSPEAFRTPRGPSLLALLPSLPSSAVTLATPALVASASDTVSPQVGRERGREGGTDVCIALSDERGVMRMREGWREG
ncbi:hypothetical protein VYU27_009767 [Nannochloropsis oceanica]